MLTSSHSCTNVQLPTYSITFNLSMLHRNALNPLFNWVTSYRYWRNSICRIMLVFEMVSWRQNCISMIIASFNVPTADGTAVTTAVLDLEVLKLWERKAVRNVEIVFDWNRCRLTMFETHNMKIHETWIIRLFCSFGTNTPDIPIKCL